MAIAPQPFCRLEIQGNRGRIARLVKNEKLSLLRQCEGQSTMFRSKYTEYDIILSRKDGGEYFSQVQCPSGYSSLTVRDGIYNH